MKNLLAFLLFPLMAPVFAQEPLTVSGKGEVLAVNADQFIGRDKFGSHYFVTDNILKKKRGETTLDYKNISKGNISHVDISNPLLVVVFYKDFNTVVLLDDQLNEVRQVNFDNPDDPLQVQAAGLAAQNKLWIYDSLQQQLLLYDYSQSKYRSLSLSLKMNFKYYQSDLNTFQWIDDKGHQYSCDLYGKINGFGIVPEFDFCSIVSDNVLLLQKNGQLYLYDRVSQKKSLVNIQEKSLKSFYYKDQNLSIFTKQGITNYKITLP